MESPECYEELGDNHLLGSSESTENNTGDSCETVRYQRKLTSYCPSYNIRTVKARGAILVLFLNTLVDIGSFGALGHVFQRLLVDEFRLHPDGLITFFQILFTSSIPFLLYPVAGWLADAHFGRYKTICTSLWFMWVGFVVQFVTFTIHFHYSDGWFNSAAYYGIFPLVFITVNIGVAGFQANIIPFGLDQMPYGSGEELSAFVHWFYWTRNIGAGLILTILLCTTQNDVIIVVQTAVEALSVTIALLCCYLGKRWLVIEPPSYNPFQTVYSVLKFASKHKNPLNRSAFTYWEEELPSRVDLAKIKYGGPFTTEGVEDVKTLIRITIVLTFLWGYIILYYTAGGLFVNHLNDPTISGSCSVGDLLLSTLDSTPILLSIPIYEFLIYPFIRKYVPTTLKRIGIGIFIGALGNIIFVAVDIQGHLHSHTYDGNTTTEIECFLVNASSANINVPSYIIIAPYTLTAVAQMLVFISAIEFICAQSPYNMKGMLIGIYYCIRGIFAFVSAIILLGFTLGFQLNPNSNPSCGTLYYTLTTLIAIAGFVAFVLVASRYKKRQRDDSDTLVNQHSFVEDYYSSNVYGAVN